MILQRAIGTTFIDAEIPFGPGPMVVHRPHFSGTNLNLVQLRVSAAPGYSFTVTQVSVFEDPENPCNPNIVGIEVGDRIEPDGGHIDFRLVCDATGGARSYPHFVIGTSDGDVVAVRVRVSTG